MCKTGKLFRVSLSGQQVWDLYLRSFDNDPIFRDPESSEHNCNHCKKFIRRYGNIVAIDENNEIMSLFDFDAEDEFVNVAKQLSSTIKLAKISEVFFETYDDLNKLPYEKITTSNSIFRLGVDKNNKRYTKEEAEKFTLGDIMIVKPNEIKTFNHMFLDLPKEFVDKSGKSVESIMGTFRDAKNVFQRAMLEIPLDTLTLVKDLINQDSLLDGKTHLYKLDQFIPLRKYMIP